MEGGLVRLNCDHWQWLDAARAAPQVNEFEAREIH